MIRLRRDRKKVCRNCRRHLARFRYRNQVRWDRKHDLCFRCWRSLQDRYRLKCGGFDPRTARRRLPRNFIQFSDAA